MFKINLKSCCSELRLGNLFITDAYLFLSSIKLIKHCILKVSVESIQKLFSIYCTLLCPNYSAFAFLMERSHDFAISECTLLFLDILNT